MSRQHISAYRRTLAEQHRITGSLNERVLRKAFADLLERMGRTHDLVFTYEWEGRGPQGNHIAVDGALVPAILRKPFGYWEAKDSKDDLDREIKLKIGRGYPDDNIIYEDTRTAILRQDGREAMRIDLADDDALLDLLTRFFAYERPELTEFREAAAKFRADLPQVLEALRMAIGEAEARSTDFARELKKFLEHAREAINPSVTADDVSEMLIQHILTEEIFASVFDNPQYHRENNVARRLGQLEAKFFTGALRHATTELLRPYYGAIKHAASALADRREKQTFLKKLYEDFYKVYNPAAADRLGVVYTPGEIVRFMIRAAEWLTEKHWGKTLADEGVEILDPATGTGTFIVELLEHMEGAGQERLRRKYATELHANEVAILPYYVANLNIEATFASMNDGYAEFPGLVFVDTLDNSRALRAVKRSTHMGDLIHSLTDENGRRIREQNSRAISVIIGNPPYNIGQLEERARTTRSKNRPYRFIDANIKATFVAQSAARKTAAYDMYSRFFRWSADRIADDGVIAFVTNRSFYDSRSFDGFRKTIADDFEEIWIVDLGGDIRRNPALSGTTHNVFGIQTGVAISFLVRRSASKNKFKVRYFRRPEFETAREKLSFLDTASLSEIDFQERRPTADGDWSEHGSSARLDSLQTAYAGGADRQSTEQIFARAATGMMTGRDDWIYSRDKAEFEKIGFFLSELDRFKSLNEEESQVIKWSRNLRRSAGSAIRIPRPKDIARREVLFRPFQNRIAAFSDFLIDETGGQTRLFSGPNTLISFLCVSSSNPLAALASKHPVDYGLLKQGNGGTQTLPRYRYTDAGARVDNITDWALQQFHLRYNDSGIGKDDIFAYCYAVLHDPVFRKAHAADLRREFPRIPLHNNFDQWAAWGRALLDLHIDYAKVERWPLERMNTPVKAEPVPKLKSDRERGSIIVDSETQLTGIPLQAWDYRLGNRSAIDWVLDQHKEKKPRDATVAAQFNTYRFAEHKEAMIKLLAKVVRVSVETVVIVEKMRLALRVNNDQPT